MREKSFDSINVVPFIDIMLVLLTIVLATATFIKTGVIPVKLPEVSHAEAFRETPAIDVTKDGVYLFDGKEINTEELKSMLSTMSNETVITVRADKESHIQPFALLMSILNEKGFEKINLQTEIEN
ncbi:MAG TPA: biopolymer transporter ExbD [Deferribacteraceae bacterium]|nr:biopolymer transporter ExbD [Deferribacteraceae bacterium]